MKAKTLKGGWVCTSKRRYSLEVGDATLKVSEIFPNKWDAHLEHDRGQIRTNNDPYTTPRNARRGAERFMKKLAVAWLWRKK